MKWEFGVRGKTLRVAGTPRHGNVPWQRTREEWCFLDLACGAPGSWGLCVFHCGRQQMAALIFLTEKIVGDIQMSPFLSRSKCTTKHVSFNNKWNSFLLCAANLTCSYRFQVNMAPCSFYPSQRHTVFGKCLHHFRQGTVKQNTLQSTRGNTFNQPQLQSSTECLWVPWQRARKNWGNILHHMGQWRSQLFKLLFGAMLEIILRCRYIIKKRNNKPEMESFAHHPHRPRANQDLITIST